MNKDGQYLLPALRSDIDAALKGPNFEGGIFASMWNLVANADGTEVIDDPKG